MPKRNPAGDALSRAVNRAVANGAPIYAEIRPGSVEHIARFVRNHPGFYVSHNDRGVTLQIECINTITGDKWREQLSVWTMAGAPHGAHRVASDALRLIALGRRASNLAVRLCNGEGRQRGRWDDVDEARCEKAKERIRRDASSIAAHYNATVDIGGDPRGYVLKLHLQSKRSNSFAGGTWGVG